MESTPTPPEARRDFSDQEQHYKSLIELFKYSVTFAGILFTVIAFVVGFITYKDGQEMRNDQRAARQEIQDDLKEMRAGIQAERDRLEQLAARSRADLTDQQKDIGAKQAAVEGVVTGLLTRAGQEISTTRTEALRQIGGVKSEAMMTARSEARNSIDDVFKARNLEDFIESVAKDKLDPKIKALVDNGIKKASTDFDSQIEETQSLGELTGGIISGDNGYAVFKLDTLARFSKNSNTRVRAKGELYMRVRALSSDEEEEKRNNEKYYTLTGDSLTVLFFKKYIPKYGKRPLPDEPTILKIIYDFTVFPRASATITSDGFAIFNRLTFGGRTIKDVYTFDFESLEKTYDEYKKRHYPLRMGKR